MSQRDKVSSPCKRNTGVENACTITNGLCEACGRNREEIIMWSDFPEEKRKRRVKELKELGYIDE
jgi:predicted Fe-S protein YdhL (DUF1289 family)